MKQILQQYAAYNLWANKLITERIKQLPAEQVAREVAGSFSSLHKTIMHMMEVENVWWERLRLVEHTTPSGWFEGNFDELAKKLLQLSQQWVDWVNTANDVHINHVFAYQNTKKELFKQPVYDVLLHLFNHQTYHRGQLVNMFRQLGIEKIPATDLILFSRSFQPARGK